MLFKRTRNQKRQARSGPRKPFVIRTLGPRGTDHGGGDFLTSLFSVFLPSGAHYSPTEQSSSAGPTAYDGSSVAGESEGTLSPEPDIGNGAPILPAVLLLGCLVMLAVTIWTSERPQSTVHVQMTHPEAIVWVKKDTGNFYCGDSILFGKRPGEYMAQADALTSGYQPAISGYCQGNQAKKPDSGGS